jgi:hypothetical protein
MWGRSEERGHNLEAFMKNVYLLILPLIFIFYGCENQLAIQAVREILSLQKDSCHFSTRRSDAQDLLLMGLRAWVLALRTIRCTMVQGHLYVALDQLYVSHETLNRGYQETIRGKTRGCLYQQ